MISALFLLPHGAQIIPLPGIPYDEAFRPLHEAMQQVGQGIKDQNIELLFLLSPHGYSLAHAFVVYLHERYQGLFYDLSESNVFGHIVGRMLWPGDKPMAEALLSAMQTSGVAAEGLVHGSPSYPLTLAWGESIPLHYAISGDNPRAVIIAIPRRRHTNLPEMQDELTCLGHLLLKTAHNYTGSVGVVISADLAHTHTAQGPYGFHESAAVFDDLVQTWARKPQRQILNELLRLQPTAMACGMAGLIVAQTILENVSFSCDMVTYAVPTYFGMMVARWR